jgi:hypothetical protein
MSNVLQITGLEADNQVRNFCLLGAMPGEGGAPDKLTHSCLQLEVWWDPWWVPVTVKPLIKQTLSLFRNRLWTKLSQLPKRTV